MKTVTAFAFLVMFAGCVGLHSDIKTTSDPYKGTETKQMAIMVASDLSVTVVGTKKDAQTGYALGVTFNGTGWMFIQSGESCVILADGKRIALNGKGSLPNREVLSGSIIRETAWYPITQDQLRQIASAHQATLKVYGQQQTREGKFTSGACQALQKFIAAPF